MCGSPAFFLFMHHKLFNWSPVDVHLGYLQFFTFQIILLSNPLYICSHTLEGVAQQDISQKWNFWVRGYTHFICWVGIAKLLSKERCSNPHCHQQYMRGLNPMIPSQMCISKFNYICICPQLDFVGVPGSQVSFVCMVDYLGTVFLLKWTRIHRTNATCAIASTFQH